VSVLRAFPDMLRIGFAASVAYRAELIIWILTATLPLVMLALWNAVAAGGPVAGLGQPELARYFAATLIVRQLTGAWVFWELNYEIRTGALSARLLRPMHPLWWNAAAILGAVPLRLIVLAPMIAGLLWWRPELAVFPGWAALGLFVVSVALAWALTFLIQALFALFAFWLDQTDGLFGLYFAVWSVLSGYVAPLAIFPAWARGWLDWLPFRATLAVPVELLGGFVTTAEGAEGVALQALWTGVLLVAVGVAWRAGVRRYGAFGA
jgi:ABC-2 type transport system permease protein